MKKLPEWPSGSLTSNPAHMSMYKQLFSYWATPRLTIGRNKYVPALPSCTWNGRTFIDDMHGEYVDHNSAQRSNLFPVNRFHLGATATLGGRGTGTLFPFWPLGLLHLRRGRRTRRRCLIFGATVPTASTIEILAPRPQDRLEPLPSKQQPNYHCRRCIHPPPTLPYQIKQ